VNVARRVLIAQAGVMDARAGAAQGALNLAEALRARGHDVVTFATGTPPPSRPGWRSWSWHRERLESLLAASPRFDVLDAPAVLLTASMARRVATVARSVQPDLRYLDVESAEQWKAVGRAPVGSLAALALTAGVRRAVERGWREARWVLCLGQAELGWMRAERPRLGAKLRHYVLAPGADDRAALAQVRARRGSLASGCRFLWIGRWSAHKGTDTLLRWIAGRLMAQAADRVTIAGCGDGVEERVRRELPEAGARLAFVPSFERASLPALLEGHDAGLFTSRAEGWGLSLQEMLESGLVVFATREGAVADLQPFFGQSLRPFPPPAGPVENAPGMLDLTTYEQAFNWPAIARAYEESILAGLQPGHDGSWRG
jgi:glycosyltransferase involved in cell wall biosynthesis